MDDWGPYVCVTSDTQEPWAKLFLHLALGLQVQSKVTLFLLIRKYTPIRNTGNHQVSSACGLSPRVQ